MCDIASLLYNTKRCDMATCYMPCYMPSCESRKSKSGCISRPRRRWRAGGRQHNASAADSLRWQESGALSSRSVNQPLLVAVAALRAAGRAEWPPASLQQAFGCGRTGDSHCSGFEVAVQPALGGARRSR